MKNNKILSLFFLLIVLLWSCNGTQTDDESTDGYTILGKITAPQANGLVILKAINGDQVQAIDSTVTDASGAFTFKGKVDEPGFYLLDIYNKQSVVLVLENAPISVNADGKADGKALVQGSRETDRFRQMEQMKAYYAKQLDSLQEVYINQASQKTQDAKALTIINHRFDSLQAAYKKNLKNTIDTMGTSVVVLYAIGSLSFEQDFGFIDSVSKKFEQQKPPLKAAAELLKNVKENRLLAIGQPAPNISLTTPDGQNITLASLKGKFVLVDFWAAWCGPCRQMNPDLVKLYNQYKGSNFEILGVSLDNNKEKWQAAIKQDKLTWLHVSDLKGWDSEAALTYQVTSIPTNFLIGADGKIIAKGLRETALADKLAEVLSKKAI